MMQQQEEEPRQNRHRKIEQAISSTIIKNLTLVTPNIHHDQDHHQQQTGSESHDHTQCIKQKLNREEDTEAAAASVEEESISFCSGGGGGHVELQQQQQQANDDINEISGRERLKKHRIQVAGQVWIPEIWGQEELLKDWIDCSAFDSSLVPNGLMSARTALAQQGIRRRDNSRRLRLGNNY